MGRWNVQDFSGSDALRTHRERRVDSHVLLTGWVGRSYDQTDLSRESGQLRLASYGYSRPAPRPVQTATRAYLHCLFHSLPREGGIRLAIAPIRQWATSVDVSVKNLKRSHTHLAQRDTSCAHYDAVGLLGARRLLTRSGGANAILVRSRAHYALPGGILGRVTRETVIVIAGESGIAVSERGLMPYDTDTDKDAIRCHTA